MPARSDHQDKPLFEPFSVREQVDLPALYQVDPLPAEFRAQLVHILTRLVGTPVWIMSGRQSSQARQSADVWEELAGDVAETIGRVQLVPGSRAPAYAVIHFITATDTSTLQILDAIETIIHKCRSWADSVDESERAIAGRVDRACAEINQRFRQHHLAYRIQDDLVLRIDSQYLHTEVTEKALELLHANDFQGALDEFLRAHSFYLDGQPRQAVAAAHSAFESTLKTICDQMDWAYQKDRDGARRLISIVVREHELMPAILQPGLRKYLEALEEGLPVLGNKKGRHGQGSLPDAPPDSIVAYALHLTAANIVLLVEALQERTSAAAVPE